MFALFASTPSTVSDKVLGTFLFLSFIAFIVLTFVDAFGTVRRWLDKKRPAEPEGVGFALGRFRRRKRERIEELGGFLAGAGPVILSYRDEQIDLEEGALDPDELDYEPDVWDDGADDEV